MSSAQTPNPSPPKATWEYAKDVLSILVIPSLLWIVSLETGNAQRDAKIQQQAVEITRLESRLDEIKDIDDRVQQNALHLARLEGKLDTANGRLDEIRALLREGNQR